MEGIRHAMDIGAQVDMQRPVSDGYHIPMNVVPEMSSQIIVITCLLHSLALRPSPIETVTTSQ